MKKKIYSTVLVVLLFLSIFMGCTPSPITPTKEEDSAPLNSPTPQSTLISAVASSKGKLSISNDPRLELLSILLSLFDYQALDKRLMAAVDFDYKTDVKKTFGEYANHDAVRILKELSSPNKIGLSFSFDVPPTLMLYLSNPPELTIQAPIPQELSVRSRGPANISRILDAMRDFAKKTNFMDFYNKHNHFYQQILAQAISQFDEKDLQVFEDYYGVNASSYNVILVPLFGQGSFGPVLTKPDGSVEIYFILGTQGLTDNRQPLLADPLTFRNKLWHEFGHSFINPLAFKYIEELNSYQYLMEPIAAQMKAIGYGNWNTVVYEHIIRAIVIRISNKVEGSSAAQKLLDEEKSKGFIYIEKILIKLEQYEQSRDKYSSLASYFPELIKAFENTQ